MGRRTVAQFAHQIKRVLSPTVLNDLGRRVGFCHRERLITPYRLVLGLLAGHATGTVETLADMQRQLNAFLARLRRRPEHLRFRVAESPRDRTCGRRSGRPRQG